jgi:putative membrane protein insertion efficiency factor
MDFVFAKGLSAIVVLYQWTLGRLVGGHCRYRPSCSDYALAALRARGPWRGLWLGCCRVLRCHPWGGSGWDPVPHE